MSFYNMLLSKSLNGGGSVAPIETTYGELRLRMMNGQLKPGALYRITDYVTKINGTYDISNLAGQAAYIHYAKSAEHPFDIIVLADSATSLNENALACLHDGDEYFANSDLGAWEIKYTIDNDPTRFSWADETNGKGVIYYMKDERNNEAGYDFKNVQYLAYSLGMVDPNAVQNLLCDLPSPSDSHKMGSVYFVFSALQEYMASGTYFTPFPSAWGVDFAVGALILTCIGYPTVDDTYLQTFKADWFYTFDYTGYDNEEKTFYHIDASLPLDISSSPVYNNKIEAVPDTFALSILEIAGVPFGLPSNIIQFIDTIQHLSGLQANDNHFGTYALFNIVVPWANFSGNKLTCEAIGNAFVAKFIFNRFEGVCDGAAFIGEKKQMLFVNANGFYDESNDINGLVNFGNSPFSNIIKRLNIELSGTEFVSDMTHSSSGYIYRADIPIDRVEGGMAAFVTFYPRDDETGDYAHIALAYDGGVSIYTKSTQAITIPQIVCFK